MHVMRHVDVHVIYKCMHVVNVCAYVLHIHGRAIHEHKYIMTVA